MEVNDDAEFGLDLLASTKNQKRKIRNEPSFPSYKIKKEKLVTYKESQDSPVPQAHFP